MIRLLRQLTPSSRRKKSGGVTTDRELLSEHSKEVDLHDLPSNLISEMEDMLGKHRGLSAVQLGAPVRIIGVNHEGIKIVMINPVMVEQNGSVSMKETCLSCPDMRVTVERPTDITVEYFDKKLKHHVNSFTLPTARVISHELDHLDGITLYDKRESAI